MKEKKSKSTHYEHNVGTPSVQDWLNKENNQEVEEVGSSRDPDSHGLLDMERLDKRDPWMRVVEEWESEYNGVFDSTAEGGRNDDNNPEHIQIPDFENMDHEDLKTMVQEMYVAMIGMQKVIKDQSQKHLDIHRKINTVKDEVKIVKKTVIKHDRAIDSADNKINQIELRSTRNNLIITGIKEEKGEKCKDKVEEFFKQQMKITAGVKVRAAFRIGNKEKDNRSIVAVLSDPGVKAVIYKHAKNLKTPNTT